MAPRWATQGFYSASSATFGRPAHCATYRAGLVYVEARPVILNEVPGEAHGVKVVGRLWLGARRVRVEGCRAGERASVG